MARNTTHDALTSRVADRPAGWGQPKGQRHAHLFGAGDMLSVCGRVLYFGETTPEPGRVKRCPACYSNQTRVRNAP